MDVAERVAWLDQETLNIKLEEAFHRGNARVEVRLKMVMAILCKPGIKARDLGGMVGEDIDTPHALELLKRLREAGIVEMIKIPQYKGYIGVDAMVPKSDGYLVVSPEVLKDGAPEELYTLPFEWDRGGRKDRRTPRGPGLKPRMNAEQRSLQRQNYRMAVKKREQEESRENVERLRTK